MNGLELDAPGIGKRYVTVCHAAVRALAQVRRAYGGRKNLRNAFSGWDPYENYVFDLLRGASRIPFQRLQLRRLHESLASKNDISGTPAESLF